MSILFLNIFTKIMVNEGVIFMKSKAFYEFVSARCEEIYSPSCLITLVTVDIPMSVSLFVFNTLNTPLY